MTDTVKMKLEKIRDAQANEMYWSNRERYPIDAFKMGFDFALVTIFKELEVKSFIENLDLNRNVKVYI